MPERNEWEHSVVGHDTQRGVDKRKIDKLAAKEKARLDLEKGRKNVKQM